MRRLILPTIIFAIIISILAFYSKDVRYVLEPIVNSIQKKFLPVAPCTEPILYSIGSFDEQFGTSKSRLENDLARAANIWNTALGKTLFIYNTNGPLKINLIYDYRQQTTSQLDKIDNLISDDKTTYDALKIRYDALLEQYTQEKVSLQTKIDAYDQDVDSYNKEVSTLNARGGASKAEFNVLQNRKQSLRDQMIALNAERLAFNQLTDTLNSIVPELNRIVRTLNLNIKTYNTVGASTGEQFSEGEYIYDASGTRINIYQFKDENQLVRVLEHEFGHALGLGHVSDSESIMYYLNSGINQKLTASDITELNTVCATK